MKVNAKITIAKVCQHLCADCSNILSKRHKLRKTEQVKQWQMQQHNKVNKMLQAATIAVLGQHLHSRQWQWSCVAFYLRDFTVRFFAIVARVVWPVRMFAHHCVRRPFVRAIVPHRVRAPAQKIKLNDNNLSPKCFNLNVRQPEPKAQSGSEDDVCVCNKKSQVFVWMPRSAYLRSRPSVRLLSLHQLSCLTTALCCLRLTFLAFLAALKLCVVRPLWWLVATA